ncbi:hypothetical protein KIH74_33105 [Kineosporia sp. J2-2]|uniref:Uncharacterized protein n=1 Tax=Kineosporia corallincola TaxID=2835133 RepID=A0ABS5TSN6_9ACTN|nr:hypothetical protein [Kineosporia corallincola]MBT0773831.1 hypothetical protein [Kineosporia corallincola]
MTKDQRLRIVFWSVFGFLGMIRAVYGAINGEVFGLVLGLLWCLFGGWKAWTEAKRVDEQVALQKQPDRPGKRR